MQLRKEREKFMKSVKDLDSDWNFQKYLNLKYNLTKQSLPSQIPQVREENTPFMGNKLKDRLKKIW